MPKRQIDPDQNIIKALKEPKLLLHNFEGNTYVKGRFI